jgi:glycosyltransferase involved in cell wall biosynthesis
MKDGYTINNPRVRVFNRIDHNTLIKVMNSCEMLVCTSRVETLHLAGVEAAACGLPLVTSNVGIYYGLESGSWGRNVNSLDYQDFIREISYVKEHLGDHTPRETFKNMGLDLTTCKEKWVNLIETL